MPQDTAQGGGRAPEGAESQGASGMFGAKGAFGGEGGNACASAELLGSYCRARQEDRRAGNPEG